jgi:tRNA pseudouridine38-40 synthase
MRNIKIIIEYDGGRYNGWQRLGDSDKTIQGKIERVISEMVKSKTEIIGSGRTDAGVHARNQVANFKTGSDMSLVEMRSYMNSYLPEDIVIKSVSEASEKFHSRYNVSGKKYSYYIWNSEIPSAFDRKYSYHLADALDLNAMKKASSLLIGTHDFIGFSSLKKSKKSTVRTVKDISIFCKDSLIRIDFVADGFLYNMVRILTGSLLEIGLGEKDIDHISDVFKSNIRSDAGKTVPAQGLFLEEVYY